MPGALIVWRALAQGARAYGMEGMQVRELLSAQYEQRRLSIVDAMDEVESRKLP